MLTGRVTRITLLFSLLGVAAACHLRLTLLPIALLPITPAHAQTTNYPLQLSIEPSVLEVAIQPGKTITKAFSLKNQGATDLTVRFTLRDFTADGHTGQPQLLNSSDFPYANLANAEFELDEDFALAAGESTQAVLKLAIPDDAPEQDWYFTLLAQSQHDGQFRSISQAAAQGTVGANVLVRVTQDNTLPLNWRLELPLSRWVDSLQPLTFIPLVHNDSDTYAIPDVHVVILNWRGKIVGEQTALPQRVLSGSSRQVLAAVPQKEDPRSLEGVPFQLPGRFALGPYRIRASVANDIDGPVVVEEVVWAWPISLVAAGLALVLGWQLVAQLSKRSRRQVAE